MDYHDFNLTASLLLPYFEKFDMHMAVVTIVLTLLGLIFNIIIFYVFWGMRKSSNALIFLNLAAVDVVMALLVMPYSVTLLLTRALNDDQPHHIFCAVSGCVFEMSVLCTVGFIFLASADRFLGVYHPIFHRKYLCRTNLIKMIACVWIVSPIVIISFVSSWVVSSLSTSNYKENTFTNLNIFTVCMGEYWLLHKHHALWNIPSYFTIVMLSLFMIVIVISNLAVLKQLFRTRPAPMASLHNTNQKMGRRNNTTTAPPMILNTEISSTAPLVDVAAKEELRRISKAEMNVKKSDRIFQTDSSGDVTGINITAIMKLYIKATRGAKTNPGPVNRRCSAITQQSPVAEIDLPSDSKSVEEPARLTPNTSTICGSLVEEDEEEDEEEEEEEEEEEDEYTDNDEEEELVRLDSDSICLDEEEFVRSVSVSPVELDEAELTVNPETETIWKVIKFVAALKRNSRKRQAWELVRSSSDSELNIMKEESSDIGNWVDNVKPLKAKDVRKYSEMSHVHYNFNNISKSKPFAYQPFTFGRNVASPTPEEIDELMNGGELSPLVKHNKQQELASLIKVVTALKKRSKEAKDRCNGQRKSRMISPICTPPDIDTGEETTPSCDEYDSGCIEDYNIRNDSPPANVAPTWGTLAVIAKMRSKLMHKQKRGSGDHEQSEIDIESPPSPEFDFVDDVFTQNHNPINESTLSSQERLEISRVAIPLNTITEEEDSPDRDPATIGESCLHGSLVLGLAPAAARPRGQSISRTSISRTSPIQSDIRRQSSQTQDTLLETPTSKTSTTTRPRRSRTLSRSRSLESCDGHVPIIPRRRRGGFLINQDDLNNNFSPSPGSDMLSSGSGNSGTYVQNAASAFKQRMRQSSVYRMGARNSMNIASVTQMVYNFNKHARKKKKEIRAAKTIIILVFFYIVTLLLFVVSFGHISLLDASGRAKLSYWLTYYSYIIYLNAVFNPVIHFWRNARVRHTVVRICCPRQVSETIRRWKLRGGFT